MSVISQLISTAIEGESEQQIDRNLALHKHAHILLKTQQLADHVLDIMREHYPQAVVMNSRIIVNEPGVPQQDWHVDYNSMSMMAMFIIASPTYQIDVLDVPSDKVRELLSNPDATLQDVGGPFTKMVPTFRYGDLVVVEAGTVHRRNSDLKERGIMIDIDFCMDGTNVATLDNDTERGDVVNADLLVRPIKERAGPDLH
jgi:hypothetical protein